MLLKPRVLPHGRLVTEGSIKHPTLAERARPREREIAVGPVHAGGFEIHRTRVEAQKYVHVAARPVAELINLVGQLK